ncbi:diacylglycerol/lipid kinase family protein [Emergencia sp.]|uniref:diacylglycerol/lipid kinase family protein n=1 Tax=Emergencia sp. TaxID=1926557 RepID=UPI003AF17941
MKRVLIILNPCAGTKQANKYFVDIIDIFCRAGYETVAATTEKRGDGTEFARSRAKDFDLIVCIGGDGTFNEVIAGVIESGEDVPIGYIPAGSTNDFANSLSLSKNVVQAARDIVGGVPRSLDIGCFNGRYFSYVASFGAFTRASYEAPQSIKNALGHLAYILEGIKDIPSIRPEKIRLKMEQGVYGGDYLFGAVSNSTSVGGILTLSDELVDMNDGMFEVLLIKSPSNILELNQILLALTKQNYQSPMISFFNSSEVEITADPSMPWTLDGEYQEGSEAITIKNLHGAIKLMVPEDDEK